MVRRGFILEDTSGYIERITPDIFKRHFTTSASEDEKYFFFTQNMEKRKNEKKASE